MRDHQATPGKVPSKCLAAEVTDLEPKTKKKQTKQNMSCTLVIMAATYKSACLNKVGHVCPFCKQEGDPLSAHN